VYGSIASSPCFIARVSVRSRHQIVNAVPRHFRVRHHARMRSFCVAQCGVLRAFLSDVCVRRSENRSILQQRVLTHTLCCSYACANHFAVRHGQTLACAHAHTLCSFSCKHVHNRAYTHSLFSRMHKHSARARLSIHTQPSLCTAHTLCSPSCVTL